MISLTFVFWMFIVLFAIMGAMRGWAKELLVSFSIILALFIITVLETYIPFVRIFMTQGSETTPPGCAGVPEFWLRSTIVAM